MIFYRISHNWDLFEVFLMIKMELKGLEEEDQKDMCHSNHIISKVHVVSYDNTAYANLAR